MGSLEKILLGLLLLAFAAFPVAVFLYLRTAYRKGGWREVKTATMTAVIAVLVVAGFRFWTDLEAGHFLRILQRPFALGSILLIVLMWLLHRALEANADETHDHY